MAVPFFLLLIGATDLGRYFITQHSLRTLTSEAARSAMINCAGSGACAFGTAAQTLWAKVPFLASNEAGASLTASRSVDTNGITTITVSAQYPFTFIVPAWSGILVNETCAAAAAGPACPSDTICETTCLTY